MVVTERLKEGKQGNGQHSFPILPSLAVNDDHIYTEQSQELISLSNGWNEQNVPKDFCPGEQSAITHRGDLIRFHVT